MREALQTAAIDVLFTTPEQLARERFRDGSCRCSARPGLLVVDEAHCISDWGHDFRPEYRRIARTLDALGDHVPVLATTATANDRVVADVAEQLGAAEHVLRGPLARESLRLQAIRLERQAERLAWLAEHLPRLPGSGIVYTLTIADAARVAAWLRDAASTPRRTTAGSTRGAARARGAAAAQRGQGAGGHGRPRHGLRQARPGLCRALPGAGLDRRLLPAGRPRRPCAPEAHAILLSGREDARIHEHFITTALPPEESLARC